MHVVPLNCWPVSVFSLRHPPLLSSSAPPPPGRSISPCRPGSLRLSPPTPPADQLRSPANLVSTHAPRALPSAETLEPRDPSPPPSLTATSGTSPTPGQANRRRPAPTSSLPYPYLLPDRRSKEDTAAASTATPSAPSSPRRLESGCR